MKIKEKPKKVTGVLTLDVYRNGVMISSDTGENLVVDTGLDALAGAMVGTPNKKITKFLAGTDNTAVTAADTALGAEEFDKVIDTAVPGATGVMVIGFSMSAVEGNGFTYAEWGLECADGTLFSHKTATPIVKDTTITISGVWTITIS